MKNQVCDILSWLYTWFCPVVPRSQHWWRQIQPMVVLQTVKLLFTVRGAFLSISAEIVRIKLQSSKISPSISCYLTDSILIHQDTWWMMCPGVIGCFRAFDTIHVNPAWAGQALTCISGVAIPLHHYNVCEHTTINVKQTDWNLSEWCLKLQCGSCVIKRNPKFCRNSNCTA